MRVLVTRPLEDASETASALKTRGHEPVLAPLMSIAFDNEAPLFLDGVQAIIATSANGVRALARRTSLRDLPVFAVGPQTAAEAHKAGFAIVKSADGDSEALVAAIPGWASRTGGALLHATGRDGAGHVAAELTAQGFDVRTAVLYAMVAVTALPDAARQGIDAVMLFSPRSAAIYAGLEGRSAGVIALCISQNTADALAPLTFREVRVAKRPNQAAMLDLISE
jgi:uroporphyrinogen-III synthase